MQLKLGKSYKNHYGDVVRIYGMGCHSTHPYIGDHDVRYTENGVAIGDMRSLDLIEEVEAITYDTEYEGQRHFDSYETPEAAEHATQEWWAEQNNDVEDGETREDEAFIVGFDDDGNEVFRKKIYLETTGEHSDYQEHRSY